MNLRVRKPYLYLLIATVLIGGSLVSVRYLKAFNLQEVTITPARLSGDEGVFDINIGTNLFSLPLDRMTENLLTESKVHRVDVKYGVPCKLEVYLNNIDPLALMICRDGRTIYNIGPNGVVFRHDLKAHGLDYPIITGLDDYKLYRRLDGPVVLSVLEQLAHIKETDPSTFLSLSNVDLSDPERVVLRLEGLPFPVVTDSGTIQKSITKLKIFLMGQNHDLSQINELDLRTDGLIIAVD